MRKRFAKFHRLTCSKVPPIKCATSEGDNVGCLHFRFPPHRLLEFVRPQHDERVGR